MFCKRLNIAPHKLFIPYQTHSNKVLVIDQQFLTSPKTTQQEHLHAIDAIVTQERGVCIGVNTADCVPVLIYDPTQEAIAVAHAGWRGLVNGVVQNTIRTMQERFNTNPLDIIAQIAPSISQRNYEVGEELLDIFRKSGFDTTKIFEPTHKGKYCLNLPLATSELLCSLGLQRNNIASSDICTYESNNLFSARRIGIQSGRNFSCMILNQIQ